MTRRSTIIPAAQISRMLFFEAGHHVAVVAGPYRGARGVVLRRTEGRPDLVRYLVQMERYRRPHWLPRDDLVYSRARPVEPR